MEITIAIIVVVVLVIIFAANSSSDAEKIEKQSREDMRKNEVKFIQVINNEPNEKAREYLKKIKKLFDDGEVVDNVLKRIGTQEASCVDDLGFEDEEARDLCLTYFIELWKRYDLQKRKLSIVEDAFEKHKLILNSGEVLYKSFDGIYCLQEKTVRKDVTYSGFRYSNSFFRAGNLSYISNDIKTFIVEDSGNLLLTNKRIIFNGTQKNFSLSMTIPNILDYYLYKDGVMLCRNNKKNVLFKEAQINIHSQPDELAGCFFLNDFPIQFISIIQRIANKTENHNIESIQTDN